jgi:hypothetical protein
MSQIMQRPHQSVIARDKDGLAEGGIRLAALAVPTQFNIGIGMPGPMNNAPPREAIGAGVCVRWGYSTDMSITQLNAHYPSHAAYVAQVRRVTDDNLKKGYILAVDAAATIREAEESRVGEH